MRSRRRNHEPPFLVTQLVVLVIFFVLGVLALMKFHPARKSG